jgi:transcriptional regulator with XRE-family HTH domain
MRSVHHHDRTTVWLEFVFARNVWSARGRLGLTLEALAHRSGILKDLLVLIEQGRADPDLHTIAILADALECEPAELCTAQSNGRAQRPRNPIDQTS